MKQIFDEKQERINPCGNGLVVLMLNEETVSVEEQRQTGEDTYETEMVEKYQYDVVEVEGVNNPVNESTIVEALRKKKIKEVEAYDKSEAVNHFRIKAVFADVTGEYITWFSAEKRNQLKQGVEAWKEAGNNTYSLDLREYGVRIEALCDELLEMIAAVERYAVKTYNITSEHIALINKLDSIETLAGYDVKKDYPEELTFELSL